MFRIIAIIIFVATTSLGLSGSLLATRAELPAPIETSGPGAESRVAADERSSPTTTISAPRADEQVLVDWARGRFVEAGLDLPPVTVRFDPTGELCNGAQGLYQHAESARHLVSICTRDSDTFAAQLDRRRTLLHEFGHVWDVVNLSTEDRDQLNELLGADEWYNDGAPWDERGAERVAETFVFALLDQPRRQLKITADCADIVAAFHVMTGAEPLGPGEPQCGRT